MAISYLAKFNKLPQEVRKKVGSQETVNQLADLEKKYHASQLASLVIKILVNDIIGHDIDIALLERGVRENDLSAIKEEIFSKFVKPFVVPLAGESLLPEKLKKEYVEFLEKEVREIVTSNQ